MVISQEYFILISIFIGAVYLLMIFLGYKKGFLSELLSLCYAAASLFFAWLASPVFADLFPLFDIGKVSEKYELIDKLIDLNSLLNTAAYFLIVFLVLKLAYLFISLVVRSVNKIPVIGGFNRLLEAVLGFFNATLIVLALSMLLSTPLVSNGAAVRENTILKYISRYSDEAFAYVVDVISENKIDKKAEGFDVEEYRNELKQWLISVRENND